LPGAIYSIGSSENVLFGSFLLDIFKEANN